MPFRLFNNQYFVAMKTCLSAIMLFVNAFAANAMWPAAGMVPDTIYVFPPETAQVDSLGRTFIIFEGDTVHTSFLPDPSLMRHTGPLSDNDYIHVARRLGVETATIKAVVEIETGRIHRGFNPSGSTVINFDLPVFRRAAARRGINLARHASSEALKPVNVAKYGSQQAAQHARLQAALQIDSIAAIESTFWGLFQIGGFNWQLCGAASRQDFVDRMNRSEYDQLLLFANYIRNSGLLVHLKNKNWAAFSRLYNGPSYAARRYHTRMAAAYQKYKQQYNDASHL